MALKANPLYQRCYHQFDAEIRHLLLILDYIYENKTDVMTLYSMNFGMERDIFTGGKRILSEEQDNYNLLLTRFLEDPFCAPHANSLIAFLHNHGNTEAAVRLARGLLAFNQQKYARCQAVTGIATPMPSIKERVDEAESIFTSIYLKNSWGSPETRSGSGSSIANTSDIRHSLPRLIKEYGITSLVDAGCGDINWLKAILPNLTTSYIGIDIVRQAVEDNAYSLPSSCKRDDIKFLHGDIRSMDLPDADMILVRDCLMHFSFNSIRSFFLNFLRANIKYMLIGFHRNNGFINKDIATGQWRMLDIMAPPFSLGNPITILKDGSLKLLALYAHEQINNTAITT